MWLKRAAFSGSALVITSWLSAGCSPPVADAPTGTSTLTAQQHTANDHSGWWCVEHGVPEEICTLCSAKAAAEHRAKGDWCDEHQRADSQCFICHPEHAERFAAAYEAKYGEKPPQPSGL